MRRVYLLSASRALCHILLFFFLGSTLNSGAHARTKHSTRSGVFVLFFLLFFFFSFCQLTIHSRALKLSVCASFKLLIKKSDSPMSCVFAVVTVSAWRTYVWEGMRKCTKRIVHVRFLYTLRSLGSTLSKFFFQACRVYEVCVDPLFFFSFFCESVEAEMTQERDQKRHQKRDFETRRRSVSTDWLQMESDCLSIADFLHDSSAKLPMLTTPTGCRPVLQGWKQLFGAHTHFQNIFIDPTKHNNSPTRHKNKHPQHNMQKQDMPFTDNLPTY